MNHYFIESFKISKLWGYRDIDLTFNNDVNILIGPNGSGKTTILNLLHSILSADLRRVLDANFDQAEIKLKSFKGRSERTVKVDTANGKLSVGRSKYPIDIDPRTIRKFTQLSRFPERGNVFRRVYNELTSLVPIVWLPVSRLLPVAEEEEERYSMVGPLESVDLRLNELLAELSDYHSRLNAQLSKRYKEFEHRVLSEMLYSKKHDQLKPIPSSALTEVDKEQLLGAFEAAELLDEQIRIRIDEHFAVAEEVLKRIGKNSTVLESRDAVVLSLISRTKAMVEYAGKLEKDRERIFASLRLYEETVNSFLNGKSAKVDEGGKLKIESSSSSSLSQAHQLRWRDQPLLWHGQPLLWQRNTFVPNLLSSGEKQILILLTQALLRVDDPVVYIADEPELSLHVLWQEKLLDSLVMLGGEIQVIVATHSPDIVGKFRDKIINLEGTS